MLEGEFIEIVPGLWVVGRISTIFYVNSQNHHFDAAEMLCIASEMLFAITIAGHLVESNKSLLDTHGMWQQEA